MALTQISTAGVKDDAVTSGKIPANAVGSSELASNAVTAAKIADGTITSNQIANGTIVEGLLQNSAVTTGKIANDAVTAAKIADGTIVAANIANDTITANQLALNSVTAGEIANNVITNSKINPSAAIARTKLANVDVVDDTSPQLGGNLQSNNKNINFADGETGGNNRLTFGNSNDLEIYHDGTGYVHTNIENTTGDFLIRNAGDLYCQSNGSFFVSDVGNSERMAKFIRNGAVELYHDNTKKFETTSDGNYYYGTITGGASARSNAGITQANVHTPSARIYTAGYANGDQSVNIQGTTGNWASGLSSTAHRSSGLLFCRTLNNTQHIRAGIQHDMHGTEKFKFHTSYGDIHFRTRNGNNGNQAWEECDRDPLIMHHNGHVSMMHMPRALMAVGSDNSSYSTDMTVHTIQGSVTLHAGITHSNGVFTVPYQGVYSVHANVGIHTSSSNTQRLDLVVNGSNWQRTEHAGHSGWQTQHITHVLELAANNTIEFRCAGRYDGSPFGRITICMLHGTLTT